MAMNTSTIGIATTVATAITWLHGVPVLELKVASATVSGWMLADVVSDSANRNSPHASRNDSAATVTMPERDTGSTTRTNAPSGRQPSTSAAASSSAGIRRKNGRRIRIANGSVIVASASTIPTY